MYFQRLRKIYDIINYYAEQMKYEGGMELLAFQTDLINRGVNVDEPTKEEEVEKDEEDEGEDEEVGDEEEEDNGEDEEVGDEVEEDNGEDEEEKVGKRWVMRKRK